MVIVVVERATPEREDGKVDQRHKKHDGPGIVLKQIGKVLLRRRFLRGLWSNALFRGGESNEEQKEAQHGPNSHRHLPAVLPVMAHGEFGNQRQRQATYDELGYVH